MKHFNLSEWLQDKSRKVVTREGKDVEIIHTNSPVPHHPIVGFIDKSIYTWTIDGKLIYGKKEQDENDLFFADEEEELTEFEKALSDIIGFWQQGNYVSKDIKTDAKNLLDLARKELEKEYPLTPSECFKPIWSEEDEKMSESICNIFNGGKSCIPTEHYITWLKSLKDRVQSKQEWSEEDYNEIETIACHLDNIDNEGMAEVLRNIRDKYYHTIPQNTWKPSDEQMNALDKAKNSPANYHDIRLGLQSLYNDLLKL